MQKDSFKPVPGPAGKYILVDETPEGLLNQISFRNTDHFNFSYDIMDPLADKYPDQTAMIYLSPDQKERRFTFRELMQSVNKTANYLKYLGVRRGDRVMLVLKRHYQFWFSILALHKIGAIAVPATYLLTRRDFEYRFRAASIRCVIASADGKIASEIDRAARSCPGLQIKCLVGGSREGWHNFNRDLRYFSDTFVRPKQTAGGRDPMLMFFTSGTTSYPKMVLHSYLYPLGHYVTARYWHQVSPGAVHLAISDTGWGKALWGKLYGQWMCRAVILIYDYREFFAKEILSLIEKYQIATFCAPPTVYRMLIHADLPHYNLSSLRNVTTAGEALSPEIFRRFYQASGLKIMEGFGQTETTLTIGNLKGTEPVPGAMGRPNPMYDIHLLRADGSECGVSETGEICIGTSTLPNGLFLGYFRDEEKTRNCWHDGFYHTGDTAFRDLKGYFHYVGRVDDLIKSAGYRVGPFEIENELMKIPFVSECAVTSVPDKLRGQAIKASLVLSRGLKPTEKLKKEVMRFIKTSIASYKRPKYVDFVEELPKTTTGKIRRSEIRNRDLTRNPDPKRIPPSVSSYEVSSDHPG